MDTDDITLSFSAVRLGDIDEDKKQDLLKGLAEGSYVLMPSLLRAGDKLKLVGVSIINWGLVKPATVRATAEKPFDRVKMETVSVPCPKCKRGVPVGTDTDYDSVGELVLCTNCGSDLKITSVQPIKLALVKPEDE